MTQAPETRVYGLLIVIAVPAVTCSNRVGCTIIDTPLTPSTTTFQPLNDTFEILKNLRNFEIHLRRLNLYNSKYLILRNGIYYFIMRVRNKVTRKSLNTDNLTLAILIKLKILQHLQQLQLTPATLYYTFFTPKNAEMLKDFKIDTLLRDIENSVNRALNIEYKPIIDTPKKEKNRLSTFAAEFIRDKKLLPSFSILSLILLICSIVTLSIIK